MAGRLAAGEMGNGVLLEEMKPAEQKLRDQMYQVATFQAGDKFELIEYFTKAHGFDEYISEYLVSLNRSLPDRREAWYRETPISCFDFINHKVQKGAECAGSIKDASLHFSYSHLPQ